MGPLLFILYINNTCEVSKILKSILFADDTNLFSCGNNLEQLLDTVEKELEMLKSWFDLNKLTEYKNSKQNHLYTKKMLGHFIYPNVGLSLLGHFSGLSPGSWVVFV